MTKFNKSKLLSPILRALIFLFIFFVFGELIVGLIDLDIEEVHDSERYSRKIDSVFEGAVNRLSSRGAGIPAWVSDQQVQHPYYGFMPSNDERRSPSNCGPGFAEYMCFRTQKMKPNHLGLYGAEFERQNQKSFRIGVTGGSVANLMVQHSSEIIVKELQKELKKDIEVINLALPGFKYPQQGMLMQHLLSRGYFFDAVVDLSGLNEVYLSRNYNVSYGVAFDYPFPFYWYPSPISLGVRVGEISRDLAIFEANLVGIAGWFSPDSVLINSRLVRFIQISLLKFYEKKVQAEIVKSNSRRSIGSETEKYILGEQLNSECLDKECTIERAMLWVKGVENLNALLQIRGTKFLSIIQPVHYVVPQSFLNKEDKKFVEQGFDWAASDTLAWQALESQAGDLKRKGIQVVNMNHPFIFKNTLKPNLVDACCHLTQSGNDILALAVSSALLNNLIKK